MRNEWDSLSHHVEKYDRKANALESLTNNLIKKKISSDLKAQIREKQQKAKELDSRYIFHLNPRIKNMETSILMQDRLLADKDQKYRNDKKMDHRRALSNDYARQLKERRNIYDSFVNNRFFVYF